MLTNRLKMIRYDDGRRAAAQFGIHDLPLDAGGLPKGNPKTMPLLQNGAQQLHYRWDGPKEGPVVVLSNSLGTDLSMWEPQLAVLASRYRVLRYDTRGHGRSTVVDGACDIEALGRDVLWLLDDQRVDKASLCGLSMGGMVATWLGANAPERVERLILSNTTAYVGPPEPWNARIETVRRDGLIGIVDTILERWFTPPFRAAHPEAVAAIRKMILQTPMEGYIACCGAVRDMDQRSMLGRIQSPTLVITATHDLATPPAAGRALAAGIPNSSCIELNAAHLANVEATADYNRVIVEFLAGASRG